jgi:mono/diheme cytochrome c family protein
MKRFTYITAILVTAIIVTVSSCDSKRQPGKVYMPDMAYSRAYETYAYRDTTKFTMSTDDYGKDIIFYNAKPVAGTIKQGELFPYTIPNDSLGYIQSAGVVNPLGSTFASHADSAEASRLFNINCAVCHGATGAANGPIADKIGAVANLTLPQYVELKDGTMFHSITYGKNNMGSYASQLDRKQRWMLVQYIRTLQPKPAAAGVAKADSTATAKK